MNNVISFAAVPALPFGDSGFGRIHGADGLCESARPHAVTRQVPPAMLIPQSFARTKPTIPLLVRLARFRYGR